LANKEQLHEGRLDKINRLIYSLLESNLGIDTYPAIQEKVMNLQEYLQEWSQILEIFNED